MRAGPAAAPAVKCNRGYEGAEALAPGHHTALAQAKDRHQVILAARGHIAAVAAPCAACQAAIVALRSASTACIREQHAVDSRAMCPHFHRQVLHTHIRTAQEVSTCITFQNARRQTLKPVISAPDARSCTRSTPSRPAVATRMPSGAIASAVIPREAAWMASAGARPSAPFFADRRPSAVAGTCTPSAQVLAGCKELKVA